MTGNNCGAATIGFKCLLLRAAGNLRSYKDKAKYKQVVHSLIFLDYVSDAFGESRSRLAAKAAQGFGPSHLSFAEAWMKG